MTRTKASLVLVLILLATTIGFAMYQQRGNQYVCMEKSKRGSQYHCHVWGRPV